LYFGSNFLNEQATKVKCPILKSAEMLGKGVPIYEFRGKDNNLENLLYTGISAGIHGVGILAG
jgi:hypothetical protein